MKKSLIALAIVCFSKQSGAVEIYSLDNVTVDMNGDVEVQYYKSESKSDDPEINIDEAKVGFDVNYEVNEDLLLGARLSLDAKDDDDDSDDNEIRRGDAYGRIKINDRHTITFGDQSTVVDDAGIGNDYKNSPYNKFFLSIKNTHRNIVGVGCKFF